MKKIGLILLALAIPLAVFAGGQAAPAGGGTPAAEAKPVTLTAYCPSNATSVPTKALLKYKELVEAASGGKILITVHHSGELGNDADSLQSARMGTIDIYFGGTSTYTTFYNKANILDMPFLFKDSNQAYDFVNSSIGEEIFKDFPSFGLVFLAEGDNGMRHIATTKKAVHTVDDVRGMKVRVPVSQVYLDVWEAMGSTPIMLALQELSIALANGTADAQDNATYHIVANATYDDIKYYSFINYMWMGCTLSMNAVSWSKLTPEQQNILKEQGKMMAKYSFDTIAEDNVTAMETLKKAGVQFDMNPDIQSFKNKLGGSEYYKRYAKEPWYNQGIIDKILSGTK
jgi:tripartite ATP-independent transporter DctP family solute receptor